jgi:hypothetical protein
MGSSAYTAQLLSLDEVDAYHKDAISALQAFFQGSSPDFMARYGGYSSQETKQRLMNRLNETNLRSALILLSALEAAFRIDYEARCKRRLKDRISREFRILYKQNKLKVRLDEDILEAWKRCFSSLGPSIGDLRAALNFRHWLAHGRHWTPKLGKKYDYETISRLAEAVLANFPFVSRS